MYDDVENLMVDALMLLAGWEVAHWTPVWPTPPTVSIPCRMAMSLNLALDYPILDLAMPACVLRCEFLDLVEAANPRSNWVVLRALLLRGLTKSMLSSWTG